MTCPLRIKGDCRKCSYSKEELCDFPYVGTIKAVPWNKKLMQFLKSK